MEGNNVINQEQRSRHHLRSHRHRRYRCRKKYYSKERQTHNRSEIQFMITCVAAVVLFMLILIPLLANRMESM